jgi:hypothetical protein
MPELTCSRIPSAPGQALELRLQELGRQIAAVTGRLMDLLEKRS